MRRIDRPEFLSNFTPFSFSFVSAPGFEFLELGKVAELLDPVVGD